jgi:acylphosphatase
VQGVGFRFTARHVALGFKVTGTVRNLDDGRVELVVEGEPQEIAGYLEKLHGHMGHNISHRTDSDAPATGQFPNFKIIY